MEISEHLSACIDIELKSADIYNSLSLIFPEAHKLFRDLSASEENHANILSVALNLEKLCRLPRHFQMSVLPHFLDTLSVLDSIRNKIEKRSFSSLSEVLDNVMTLEEKMAEGYFHEFMKMDSDSDVIKYLKKFYEDEKSHYETIKEFRERKTL